MLTGTNAWAHRCVQFLTTETSTSFSLATIGLQKRVQWDVSFEPVMKLLIERYGASQLTSTFVSKLTKTDLMFLAPHINATVSGTSIIAHANIKHGSWYKALEAQGVSLSAVSSNRKSLSQEQIIGIVKTLSSSYNLNVSTVRTLEIKDPVNLKDNHGNTIKGPSFYAQAVSKFGSWEAVLVAAGLDPVVAKNQFPDAKTPYQRNPKSDVGRLNWTAEKKDLVIDILREKFGDEKIDFNFIRSLTKEDLVFASERLGFEISGHSILNAFKKPATTSWYDALKAKGVNVEALRTRNLLTFEEAAEIVRKIHREHNLNTHSMVRLSRDEIYNISGIKISGSALYAQITQKFNYKYYDFLAKIGLSEVKPFSPLTHDQITNAIIEISKRTNPNFRGVLRLSKEDLHYLDINRTGHAIIENAVKLFGSWDQALVASGLNPDKIRITGVADYKILTPAMQQQRQRLYEYSLNYEQTRASEYNRENKESVVTDNVTAETLYLKNETQYNISNALRSLSEKEQWLFDLLTDKMLEQSLKESYEGFNMQSLVKEVLTSYENITPVEITSLFGKISSNAELRDALLNP